MARRTLLQSGQIWTPQSTDALPRHILDFPEGLLSYELVHPADAPPSEERDEFIIQQSLFRKWIRENDAVLTDVQEEKASPALELSKKIVTLRKMAGMSQVQLAEELNLSRSAIAAMETGRTSSARKHIPRLAELFQVPIELFLSGMVEQNFQMELSSDEHDLICLYRYLSPTLKLNVQKYTERQTRKEDSV
ncbi:MAG: helix-turn-helix domain-containing protein [Acetobacter sp.]|jgi:transcriptional regulator with XRE-family HTH domain|nr:helix-turn-helix domain-containing protein [Acetobacter sp.]MCH4061832.1 helix-turn-helix domain-containing protein [Acetobacter sp.]MCH4089319.1 helix-turn-helix domain-containing protein [Acetobacter sp.]MCI1294203.1 helix-turn-helix domain-containing protein [Acetobacter sp.]MCI1320788.1 helix-turn-helix domain-containing protein [Acetobacter sp.]